MSDVNEIKQRRAENLKRFRHLRPQEATEAEAVFLARVCGTARGMGWLHSALAGVPLDRNQQPCPWYTYPILYFLATRDLSKFNVFEYGSGYSTLWWSRNAASVTSCEHDKEWFDRISIEKPENVTYIHRELVPGGDYCREILCHSTNFDIIVVDGRDRVNCVRSTLEVMGPQAVIIWDNSERSRYAEGRALLAKCGFRHINFYGFGPVHSHMWTTTIYYRDGNCLGI
jgi:hypothetical protein